MNDGNISSPSLPSSTSFLHIYDHDNNNDNPNTFNVASHHCHIKKFPLLEKKFSTLAECVNFVLTNEHIHTKLIVNQKDFFFSLTPD